MTDPESKGVVSNYNKIGLVDLRKDTTNLGIVQKGAFNRKEYVYTKESLSQGFQKTLTAIVDSNSASNKLLLVVREMSFAEITKSMNERGYFHFRANMFTNDDGQLKELSAIDTVAETKGMDVTKAMLRNGSTVITEFILNSILINQGTGNYMSNELLWAIDSIEKNRLPLYREATLTNGLYYSYKSFSKQVPDETGISISFDKKGKPRSYYYTDKKGSQTEIENRFFYAVVFQGKPYISGEFACYPLERKENDFYFTGKVVDVKAGSVATAQFFFGIMGALMASSATSVYELRLDHLSGAFIREEKIK
jgi:hypothetical protein